LEYTISWIFEGSDVRLCWNCIVWLVKFSQFARIRPQMSQFAQIRSQMSQFAWIRSQMSQFARIRSQLSQTLHYFNKFFTKCASLNPNLLHCPSKLPSDECIWCRNNDFDFPSLNFFISLKHTSNNNQHTERLITTYEIACGWLIKIIIMRHPIVKRR